MLSNAVHPNESDLVFRRASTSSATTARSRQSSSNAVAFQDQDIGKEPQKDAIERAPSPIAGPAVQQPVPLPPPADKAPEKQAASQQGVPACPVGNDNSVQFGGDNVTTNDIYISNQLAGAMPLAMKQGVIHDMKARSAFKKVCKHIVKNPPSSDLPTLLNAVRLNHTGPAVTARDSNVLDAATAVKVASVQERAAALVVSTSGRVLSRWADAVVSSTKKVKVKNRQSARNLIEVTQSFVAEAIGDQNLRKTQQASLEVSRDALRANRTAIS